jgi:hypothetical protein
MAEHVWTIVCYKSLVDDSNIVSLIDVAERLILHPLQESESVEESLEKVRAEGKKGVFFPVTLRLVTHWVRSEWGVAESAKMRVSLVDPSGENLLEQEQEITLVNFIGSRLTMNFDAFRVTTLGYYWFEVERESNGQWERVARIPLEIIADA